MVILLGQKRLEVGLVEMKLATYLVTKLDFGWAWMKWEPLKEILLEQKRW